MICLKINDTLRYFKNVITEACENSYHYAAPSNSVFPYLIWQEYTEGDSLHASNRKKEQPLTILVDYYTQDEFDPTIDAIQNTMNSADGVVFDLSDIQYDDETMSIHYSWNVEVLYGKNRNEWI